MAHESEAIALHSGGNATGLDPGVDFVPADGVVVEHARDLVEAHASALEDVGDLRHGAR